MKFTFNLEWCEFINELDPDDRLKVYDAIFSYAIYGQPMWHEHSLIRYLLAKIEVEIDNNREIETKISTDKFIQSLKNLH